MKSQCLLISPPGEQYVFPRGIMEIATFLNSNGCKATVLPLGHYYKKKYLTDECGYIQGHIDPQEFHDIIADEIHAADPAMVGVSNTYTSDFPNCIEIIKLCKQIKPDIITVMGGQHVTFLDKESLDTPELDIVVRGEGEWVLLNLIHAVRNGVNLLSVPGTTVRIDGKAHRNPPQPLGNLQEIPPVDFGLLPEKFVQTAQINGILHRGCAYHCNYCVEKNSGIIPGPTALQKLWVKCKPCNRPTTRR